jgi:hypothetical protein
MGWTDNDGKLTARDKANILIDCLMNEEIRKELGFRPMPDQYFKLYAWRPGSSDVKIIAAIDDESAARIAVQARIDLCGMTEQEALEHVTTRDLLAEIDLADPLFQGEAPLWDGLRKIGGSVDKA